MSLSNNCKASDLTVLFMVTRSSVMVGVNWGSNRESNRGSKFFWPSFYYNSHIWPPPVAIFLALRVWKGT